jgi:polyhydroxybutyrate depolymerase
MLHAVMRFHVRIICPGLPIVSMIFMIKNKPISAVILLGVLLAAPLGLIAQETKEKSSRRERLMQRFDENNDGKLDEAEREAVRKFLSRTRQAGQNESAKRVDKIHVPKDYDPKKKYPFVLTLHGYSSNGRGQLGFFPMSNLAEEYDFIYCAPNGIDRSWNATDVCCGKLDDSKYLRSLILKAMEEYNIDKKRVYVTGLSNGGFMSYRMAHDHSDLITAIVPFAGVGFEQWPTTPNDPVSVLHIHGTQDKTIKWAGGSLTSGRYPSVEDNFAKWKAFNKCENKINTSDMSIDLDRKVEGEETKVVRYETKDGKVVTELWEVVNGGHVTPPRSAARKRIIEWMLARKK